MVCAVGAERPQIPNVTVLCNDEGSPLVEHNYSAGLQLSAEYLPLASQRRTQPMRSCVVGPALSPRGLFSSLFFYGVVPVRALLFRTGFLLPSLVRQARACRLALGPSEVLVV